MLSLDEFEITSNNIWEDLISKALKINSLSEFDSKIEQGINLPSFNHPAEFQLPSEPLKLTSKSWRIGLKSNLSTDSSENWVQLGLDNGLEALNLALSQENDFEEFLAGVYLKMIYIDLDFKDEPTIGLQKFIDFLDQQKMDSTLLEGAINLSIRDIQALPSFAERLPKFHFIQIQSSALDIIQELTEIIHQLKRALLRVKEGQIKAAQIRVNTEVGVHLSLNVAKLRSIRLLWANLLQMMGLDFSPLFIKVESKIKDGLDKETQLIENTTACINAVMGTADLIYSFKVTKDWNQARLLQNVQHILKLEARLDQVQDPLAGSYAIEKLTQQIASQVWNKFYQAK